MILVYLRYIRRCILLLTCPESEVETGFSLRKIQPDCTFLKFDDLQNEAKKWVELLIKTLHEGQKLQPKDLRVGFKVALEVALIREQVLELASLIKLLKCNLACFLSCKFKCPNSESKSRPIGIFHGTEMTINLMFFEFCDAII